jgi:anti-sigma B factor antagonist
MIMHNFATETGMLTKNGPLVLRVKGSVDAHTYGEFETVITDLMSRGVYKVAVELSEVEYLASAGIGVLISALSRAQEHGGTIVLMNPTEHVLGVLDVLGMTHVFDIVDDDASAIEVLSNCAA